MNSTFLSIENLSVSFKTPKGIVKANDAVSLKIGEGEILGLIGETGCGKSTLGKALLRLLSGKVTFEGKIIYRGKDLLTLSEKEMRNLRGKEIGLMFQNPSACLNPVLSVGRQIAEVYRYHEGMGKKEAESKACEMLELVGISPFRRSEYPHQFSGGMLQRVMVAIGLALKPRLLIADEPTKGLDPEAKMQIADMIVELVRKQNSSLLLITHDLELAGRFADRIAVMYAGEIVEVGKTDDVISSPQHPYTFDLLSSLPEKGLKSFSGQSFDPVYLPSNPVPLSSGLVPFSSNPVLPSSGLVSSSSSLFSLSSGCRYYPRCNFRLDICSRFHPPLLGPEKKSLARCLFYEKNTVVEKTKQKTEQSVLPVISALESGGEETCHY